MKSITSKLILRIFIVSVIYLLLATSSVWATTYYVNSSSGNDDRSGITESDAWRTLNKVNSMTFKPGDFIRFKRGEVWKEEVSLKVNYSGTPDNWIVFSDYGSGNLPIFDFSSNFSEGFYIYYQDYIKIQNIHIYNAYREGITVYGKESDRTKGFHLAGCIIEDNGLRRGASDFGIDAAYIDDLSITDTKFDGNQQSGVRIQSCRSVIIARCEAKNHLGGDDHDGFLIQNTDRLEMYDCIAHNNSESGIDIGGHEFYTSDMRNANIYRCFVYNNGDDGIAISGCAYDDQTPFYTHNIYFFNCLSFSNGTYNLKMYQNAYDLYFFNCLFDDSKSHNLKVDVGAHDITFRNCIVSNSGGNPINIWSNSDYPIPYNLDFNFMIWYPKIPEPKYRGTTYMNSDPKFTNISKKNYSVQFNSPAKDEGTDLGEKYKYGLDPAYEMYNILTLDQNSNKKWEIGPYVYPSLNRPINLHVFKN